MDVVKFFSDNVFQDLQEGVHPILQVDAIRFLHTFRNQVSGPTDPSCVELIHYHTQLTKSQLLSVLPLLIRHISSGNYVSCTYAAITINRILSIKQDGRLM